MIFSILFIYVYAMWSEMQKISVALDASSYEKYLGVTSIVWFLLNPIQN